MISVGQTVSGTCIGTGTAVTGVWPARGIVYISKPPACSGNESISFQDTAYAGGPSSNCSGPGKPVATDVTTGCVLFDAAFRFGDGLHMEDATGVDIVNCLVFDHEVAFHMYGKTKGHAVNCNTGNGITLPDRNLAGLTTATAAYQGNMVGLLIDGPHSADTDDACNISWTNALLGQHRPYGVVVQSSCTERDLLTNVSLGVDGNQGTGASLELDAGSVSLENADSSTGANILKAEGTTYGVADLAISNNSFPKATLYMEDTTASATTRGCGNVFKALTPYLCAPSSFTQLPGGRLTLVQGQPVMTADTTATTVYYAPYVSQQVPLYNTSTGVFGLSDVTPDGLVLRLDTTAPTASTLYDVFAELDGNDTELCAGPAWSNSGAGTSARASDITQVSGVWVNKTAISCAYHHGSMSGSHACVPLECTYLGTLRTTSAGSAVAQQFSPLPMSGGTAPCLCLYNAYNRVGLTSRSIDNVGYTFSSALPPLWRPMHGATANNYITVVDGLGQMQIGAQLTDLLANNAAATRTAEMGIDFNPPATTPAPTPLVQAGSATPATYTSTVPQTPVAGGGLWVVQAVEAAVGTGAAASFGSSTGAAQQLSVQVAD